MEGVGEEDAGDTVPFIDVVGGARENRTRRKLFKWTRITGKWILHLSYIMILFGAFGGLISERVNIEENPKFTASFLGGIFVLCL